MGASYSMVNDHDQSLPVEIVLKILLYLSVSDLASCRCLNKTLHDIISDSSDIQHQIDTALAGVVDNPHVKLSFLERRHALRLRQEAWNHWKPQFKSAVQTSSFPDLIQDGVYFKLDHPDFPNSVGYCIPPQPQQGFDLLWTCLNPLPGRLDYQIVTLAVCLQDNDLVAVGVL